MAHMACMAHKADSAGITFPAGSAESLVYINIPLADAKHHLTKHPTLALRFLISATHFPHI